MITVWLASICGWTRERTSSRYVSRSPASLIVADGSATVTLSGSISVAARPCLVAIPPWHESYAIKPPDERSRIERLE